MPLVAKNFDTHITVNREIFVEGIKKAVTTIGFEDNRPLYLCLLFDASKNGVKFTAGTGAQFVIDEIVGNAIVEEAAKQRVAFPKNNISNIISILKSSTDEKIVVKEAINPKDAPEQIVITAGETVLTILGIDPQWKTKYVDVAIVTGTDHPYRVKVKRDENILSFVGIARSTLTPEYRMQSDVHNSELTFDFKKCVVDVNSKTNVEAKWRTKFEVDRAGTESKMTLLCNSIYLEDMLTKGVDKDFTIRFIQQDKPIVVDFDPIDNSVKGTVEKFTMFFTTSKKQ